MANQTIGEMLAPILIKALRDGDDGVAADLQVINDWRGVYPHSDHGILSHVIHRLGIEGAFSPEALAVMAGEYRAMERRFERQQPHNAAQVRAYLENDHG